MDKNAECYCSYINILKRELVPAMGCTEPIAVAYCAAKAREVLGEMPKTVEVLASGNIIKNVKSVIIPNVFIIRLLTPEIIGKCTAFLSIIFVSVLSLLI